MKQRDTVSMPPDEVAMFLAAGRKLQLATLNPDGTPHLVSMFYAMRDGRIAFWTYRASQKARNLARDPRITCLIEDGEDYFELRGVQIAGVVRTVEDVASVGRLVAGGMAGPSVRSGAVQGQSDGAAAEVIDDYVARAAAKRAAYVVEPQRVVSWDHRRLT